MSENSQPAKPPPRRYLPADPRAISIATDIDRRTCTRKVPLKVMCLGISRTGTCSLRQALLDLGYQDVYHYAAMLNENPRDAIMWAEALEAKYEGKGKPFKRKDWDQLLGHCEAITDNPCIMFHKELLEAYPDALVVLTVRDSAEAWWASLHETIVPFLDAVFRPSVSGKMASWFFSFFQPRQSDGEKALNRVFKLQDDHTPYLTHDANKAISYYHSYNAEIKRLVPAERLLVFNVKQGWKPLCKFLDKEVPHWDFPRSNDAVSFNKNIERGQKIILRQIFSNMAKSFGAVLAVGAAGLIWRYMHH